jgi:hypothetical protein
MQVRQLSKQVLLQVSPHVLPQVPPQVPEQVLPQLSKQVCSVSHWQAPIVSMSACLIVSMQPFFEGVSKGVKLAVSMLPYSSLLSEVPFFKSPKSSAT